MGGGGATTKFLSVIFNAYIMSIFVIPLLGPLQPISRFRRLWRGHLSYGISRGLPMLSRCACIIRQSSTNFMTYIQNRMYNNSWFVSLLHIMWCEHPVYRLEKLMLTEKDQRFLCSIFSRSRLFVHCAILILLLMISMLVIAENYIVSKWPTLSRVQPFLK